MKAATRRKAPSFADAIRLRGCLEFELKDSRTGEVIRKGKAKNVVTYDGRSWVIDRIVSTDAQVISALAMGTDASATASNQTNLAGYFSIRTVSLAKTTNTNAVPYFQATVSWNSNETHASSSSISEFALYQSGATGAGGRMFNRVTTATPINFGSTNTLAVTLTVSN